MVAAKDLLGIGLYTPSEAAMYACASRPNLCRVGFTARKVRE